MLHSMETKSERKKLRVKASVNCPFPLLEVVMFWWLLLLHDSRGNCWCWNYNLVHFCSHVSKLGSFSLFLVGCWEEPPANSSLTFRHPLLAPSHPHDALQVIVSTQSFVQIQFGVGMNHSREPAVNRSSRLPPDTLLTFLPETTSCGHSAPNTSQETVLDAQVSLKWTFSALISVTCATFHTQVVFSTRGSLREDNP